MLDVQDATWIATQWLWFPTPCTLHTCSTPAPYILGPTCTHMPLVAVPSTCFWALRACSSLGSQALFTLISWGLFRLGSRGLFTLRSQGLFTLICQSLFTFRS